MTTTVLVLDTLLVGTLAHIMAVTTAKGTKVVGSRGLAVSNIVPIHNHSTLNHIIVDKTNLEKGNFTISDPLKQVHIAIDSVVNRCNRGTIKSLLSHESHLFQMKIDYLHRHLFL